MELNLNNYIFVSLARVCNDTSVDRINYIKHDSIFEKIHLNSNWPSSAPTYIKINTILLMIYYNFSDKPTVLNKFNT